MQFPFRMLNIFVMTLTHKGWWGILLSAKCHWFWKAIIWSHIDQLSIIPSETKFNSISIKIPTVLQEHECQNVVCKMSATVSHSQCMKGMCFGGWYFALVFIGNVCQINLSRWQANLTYCDMWHICVTWFDPWTSPAYYMDEARERLEEGKWCWG